MCSCRSYSCLSTSMSSPVPPSQTLGVLFFPLSPPSRKGATHNQRVLAPQLASQGWATTQNWAEASQLLLENQLVSSPSSPIPAKTQKPLSSPSPIPLTPLNPNSPFDFSQILFLFFFLIRLYFPFWIYFYFYFFLKKGICTHLIYLFIPPFIIYLFPPFSFY
jgi:hypothetical protein